MLNVLFATKKKMSQAWTTGGKRLAVTRLAISPNVIIGAKDVQVKTDASKASSLTACKIVEVGYGDKKLKSMSKALRTRLEKANYNHGVRNIAGVRIFDQNNIPTVGTQISASEVFQAGDLVKVQGVTKGKGFAGGMKRHGFHGGPRTHGQSDRARATGSIGQHTEPGRVFPGKKMPGHFGVDTQTVTGLQVLYVSNDELWLSGPIPGSINSIVRIEKTGTGKALELNQEASALPTASVTEVVESIETNAETPATEEAEVVATKEEIPVVEETATEPDTKEEK